MISAAYIVKALLESDELDAGRYFDDLMQGWRPIDKISEEHWRSFFRCQGYELTRFEKNGRENIAGQLPDPMQVSQLIMTVGRDVPAPAPLAEASWFRSAINGILDNQLGEGRYKAYVNNEFDGQRLNIYIYQQCDI